MCNHKPDHNPPRQVAPDSEYAWRVDASVAVASGTAYITSASHVAKVLTVLYVVSTVLYLVLTVLYMSYM